MKPPPELSQVAEWLRAIEPDASYLEELEHGYYDIKYPDGLTVERHVIEQWRFRRDDARRALDGIDLAGKDLDEIAEAYHHKQIAAHAMAQRDLQQQIRALRDGDFEPPSSCAQEAAARGISLEQVIDEYRQSELYMAQEELARLFGGDVREEEAQAYWAATDHTQTATTKASSGSAAINTVTAGLKPAPALVPTASQIAYAKVMAEAALHHRTLLKAQADQACKVARDAGWGDTNANNRAAAAVHADDMAARHYGGAERSKWHIQWQDPRRAAVLAWHGQHPVDGQPLEPPGGVESPATPEAKAELGRLYRVMADLMEQAGIPGIDVSCSPDRSEITIRVPEDHGDILYQAIGPELMRIRNRLAEISGEITRAWPRRSVANDRASAVVGPVDRLRDELAAQFRRHHEGDYSPDTYFPLRAVYEPIRPPRSARGQIRQHETLPQEYARDHRPTGHGLSPERHQAIGPELIRIRNRLAEISGEITRAWPRRSVANDRAGAVVGPVDRLRDELAAQFRRHHEGDYSPDAYYAPRAARAAQDKPALSRTAPAAQVAANAPKKATSATGRPLRTSADFTENLEGPEMQASERDWSAAPGRIAGQEVTDAPGAALPASRASSSQNGTGPARGKPAVVRDNGNHVAAATSPATEFPNPVRPATPETAGAKARKSASSRPGQQVSPRPRRRGQ